VNILLKRKLEEIIESGKSRSEDLEHIEVDKEDMIVIFNPSNTKACLLKYLRNRVQKIICYGIDVKTVLWAEKEGFTKDDMIQNLNSDLFIPIEIKKVEEHLFG
jgi:hypothetical protein